MTEINFHKLRAHGGSRNEGFEELTSQLLSFLPPDPKARWIRKRGAGGDGGVEGYWTLPNGDEHCIQSKYFFELGDSQRSQINKSVQTMLEKHPRCVRYVIALPFDLTDARKGKAWSQRQHWAAMEKKWKEAAKGREVEFEIWDASKLTTLLAVDEPLMTGRRHYWFDERVLSNDWFEKKLKESIANLGRRYTPEFNVELDLSKSFSAFLRDPAFWLELADLPDLPRSHSSAEEIKPAEDAATKLVAQAHDKVRDAARHRAADAALEDAAALLKSALSTVQNIEVGDDRELQSAFYRLYDTTNTSLRHLKSVHAELVAEKAILLHGPAGSGKSHLLADIAAMAVREGRPAVLLLGQQYKDGQASSFLRNALDLDGNIESFLGALDAAGQERGCRALLAIDALNEGKGNLLWPDQLAGLAEKVSHFPNIGLVVSCRENFVRRIFRNCGEVQFHKLWHGGFSGHEEAAARAYMDGQGISRPDAPFLDPEFSNPLFLKTICEAVVRRGEGSFPKGLRGVTAIFEYYLKGISEAINLRMELDENRNVVPKLINLIIDEMIGADEDFITRERAYELADSVFSSDQTADRSLVQQLCSEGILTDDVVYDGAGDDVGKTVIRFAYERYLDHFRALRFAEKHITAENVKDVFAPNGVFQQYLGDRPWSRDGFIHALAVIMPEMFDCELCFLIEHDKADDGFDPLDQIIVSASKESVVWRDPTKTNDETLRLFNEVLGGIGPSAFETMLRCAVEPQHAFNARMLHRNLARMEMPNRDQTWSAWCVSQWGNPEEMRGTPVWTLIDWAWEVDPLRVDDERAYLACLALTWLLTAPRRSLRDRATKALVALLEKRVSVTRRLLLEFDGINDLHLLERLYAAAYAVALEVGTKEIAPLARTVINRVYRSEQKYAHLLLQDYARGIVLLADRLGVLPKDFSLEDARNSVGGPWPLIIPSPDEIALLRDDVSQSHSSVMGGDFGIYTMRDVFDFSPTSLEKAKPERWEELLKGFVEEISKRDENAAAIIDRYVRAIEEEREHSNNKSYAQYGQKKTSFVFDDEKGVRFVEEEASYSEEAHESAKLELTEAKGAFERLCTVDEQDEWRWLSGAGRGRDLARYSRGKAKRWIVQRVKELGWSKERFEQFERIHCSRTGRNDHDAERMGKKYQWIAYHEFLARLSQHCFYLGGYTSEEAAQRFEGAWQLGRRDIDPTLLHRGELLGKHRTDAWWLQTAVDLSDPLDSARSKKWVSDTADLLSAHTRSSATNPTDGREVIVLHSYEHVMEAGRRYHQPHRSSGVSVSTIVARNKDISNLVQLLREKNLIGGFSGHGDYSEDAFLGEYPWHGSWHPEWPDFDSRRNPVSGFNTGDIEIHYPYRRYSAEISGYDHSLLEGFACYLPSRLIMRDLELSFRRPSIDFRDSDGRAVFFDPARNTKHENAAVVDKDVFSSWLSAKKLSAISLITQSKQFYEPNSDSFAGELVDCQISVFDGKKRSGERWTILTQRGPKDVLVRPVYII